MAPARSPLQANTRKAKILAMHGRALDCTGMQSTLFLHVGNLDSFRRYREAKPQMHNRALGCMPVHWALLHPV
ncbi:hypothetical protein L1987_45547 [Smallanthus sonchifolius]|uniref:Uncharacterized protein n=1 Tax=Smallanthus sonchifolius TaxID=185202 RepID=A0ACB9FX50_9ASTR|nr:hypothetical protein L1987_45547 [Smallanthus sonchifolius]